jgi:putative ABC transport system permease protein
VESGVDAGGVVTMLIIAPPARYSTPEKTNAFFDQVTEGVSTLPGVQAVGLCDCLPPTDVRTTTSLIIDGRATTSGELPLVNAIRAGGSYFGALRIPVLAGRAFTSADRLGAPAVAVVNRALAVKLLGGAGTTSLGRRVSYDGTNWMTVVGVVDDVHYDGLAASVMLAVYTPLAQRPEPGYNLIVRATGDAMAVVPAMRRVVAGVDPDVAPSYISSLENSMAASLAGDQFNSVLLGTFAAIAFVLAAVGIYGVVAYGVTQRRRELGIRIALGAQGRDVVRMVVARSLRPVLLGVVLGILMAGASARVLQRMLYSTSIHDINVYGLVAIALTGVATLAAWLPGRRAAGADPMTALRGE